MTGFEFNEEVKEKCLKEDGIFAVTLYFKNGVPIIPEPFYETTILLNKKSSSKAISEAIMYVQEYLQFLKYHKFSCTDVLLEFKKEYPQIVYTIYPEGKDFQSKELKYIA